MCEIVTLRVNGFNIFQVHSHRVTNISIAYLTNSSQGLDNVSFICIYSEEPCIVYDCKSKSKNILNVCLICHYKQCILSVFYCTVIQTNDLVNGG